MDGCDRSGGGNSAAVIYDGRTSVTDRALEGWVKANTGLVILEGRRTILRRDYRQLKSVRILSGGWSGSEPMPIGFVGPGMLTAAVVGESFTAPPYTNILAAIRELNDVHGVLVIAMNHPALKVNFGLAVDIARREGVPVKLIFVSDDCSGLAYKYGRKGLAGTVMIFKIAGSMADKNWSLEAIASACSEICSGNLSTVSFNILNEKRSVLSKSAENNRCSVDDLNGFETGSLDEFKNIIQVKADVAESIDGTGAVSAVHKFVTVDEVSKILIGYLIDGSLSPYNVVAEPGKNIVLLFNNYGSVLNLELNSLVHELTTEIERRSMKIERIYIGSVITTRSLAFSVTAMKVDKDIVAHLDYATDVSSWPSNVLYKGVLNLTDVLPRYIKSRHHYTSDREVKLLGPILSDKQSEKVFRVIEFVVMALISCEEQINKMCQNSSCTIYGSYIKAGAEEICKDLYENKLKLNCPYALLNQLSTIAADHLQDLSGSCYAVFFEGASQAFLPYFNQSEATQEMWIDALENGIKAIELLTKIERGERTMLDALYPALEAMKKFPENYAEIAEAAELGSLNTVDGNNKRHALPDPGSHVVAIWVRAAVEALNTFNKMQVDVTSLSGDFYDEDSSFISLML